MPHVRSLAASLGTDRVFARIDRFQVACPSCGQIIFSAVDRRAQPLRLHTLSKRQSIGRVGARSRRAWEKAWNPLTHHLTCPYCGCGYMVGLVLYPIGRGLARYLAPPPDVVPDARELAALRAKAAG